MNNNFTLMGKSCKKSITQLCSEINKYGCIDYKLR